MWATELTIMLAMIAINSVFAAYEIALASISTSRLRRLAEGKRTGARVALFMKENMEASLAVVQLGITLVGAIAAATAGAGAEQNLAPWIQGRFGLSEAFAEVLAISAVVLPLTVVSIMFGELVPKVFALRHKEWVCLSLSPAMRLFAACVRPAVWFFETSVTALMNWSERRWRPHGNFASEEEELQELRASVALARTSRLIGEREEKIILGAARLSRHPIRELMLPANEITMLNLNDSIGECLVVAHLEMHTRFPVAARPGDAQSIAGYVNFKDIIAHMRMSPGESSLKGIMRRIPEFREDTPTSDALEQLMRERVHIALVRGEAGEVTGLLTMEDIIEELVGDIQDEYDQAPGHVSRSGSGWVVGGGISLARLNEVTGMDLAKDLPAAGASHLDAWVSGHLGRPVGRGDVLERAGVRVAVRKVRRQQLHEAQIGRVGEPANL